MAETVSNDPRLDVMLQQVARLEAAVQSLSLTVLPRSEVQFRILAEGPLDHLMALRRDIDVYLGKGTGREHEEAG